VPYDVRQHYNAVMGIAPLVYQTSSPDSSARMALASLAYANFGGRYRCQEARLAGAEQYGKALKQVAANMKKGVKEKTMENMMAVCLLGLYEVRLKLYSSDGGYETRFLL
jgi:hypothetical protein